MIYQLFYVSGAAPGLTSKDIEGILAKARPYNQAKKIKGALMFSAGMFLQLLEGDKEVVRDLFESRIKPDKRHDHVIEMLSGFSKERIFPDWSMAYMEESSFDLRLLNEVLAWHNLINAARAIDKNLILHMMERFRAEMPEKKSG